jgi:hypothetical protein
MKVAGFTFIRNAVQFDFPVVEAINSILPLCDEFFVAVGQSEDGTRDLIQKISPLKIRIIDTVWNDELRNGGAVYADETNKAFNAIPADYEWCFYIQGDEVLHEKYIDMVKTAMQKWLVVNQVEGLLFNYRHFYGTYDYTGDSRHWYRREVRIIRNDKKIRSYHDAQGFRKNGRKIMVVPADAEIYHYGWVRHPLFMQKKIDAIKQFYEGVTRDEAIVKTIDPEFNYGRNYDALARFTGTHPQVMLPRIARLNWQVDIDVKKKNMNLRYRMLYWFEKMTGIRPFEFRNYKILSKGQGQ